MEAEEEVEESLEDDFECEGARISFKGTMGSLVGATFLRDCEIKNDPFQDSLMVSSGACLAKLLSAARLPSSASKSASRGVSPGALSPDFAESEDAEPSEGVLRGIREPMAPPRAPLLEPAVVGLPRNDPVLETFSCLGSGSASVNFSSTTLRRIVVSSLVAACAGFRGLVLVGEGDSKGEDRGATAFDLLRKREGKHPAHGASAIACASRRRCLLSSLRCERISR